jgi:hypothetical protein
VSASADDNARTTDDLSIPPFLDGTNDAPTQTRLAEAKPTISAQVLTLVRRVKALIEKGDRAAEKAEQFYKSAGIHTKEIKEQSEDWETIVREKCGIGRSRAYELMAIADGKTTPHAAPGHPRRSEHSASTAPECHHIAINRLRNARDEIELATRPPGERITISRQAAEAVLADLDAVAALIRKMADR